MSRRAKNADPRVVAGSYLLVLLALIALGWPGVARASTRVHPAAAASAGSARAEAARVARYWTPERMRRTQPLDAPRRTNPFASISFSPVDDATTPPFQVNGRVFVKQGNKKGYCSGTAINSETRRLVITAAHCVNSGPEGRRGRSVWSRYMQFVPAYSDGQAPFGSFIARRGTVYAPRDWIKWRNPDYDVGAFLTMPNREGVNVADAVGGGATILLNKTRRQRFQTFGYPGKVHLLQTCYSGYAGDDAHTYPLPGPPTIGIRCHWTPGASGGGWLVENGTAINGLTSYGRRGGHSRTFGPYFNNETVGRLVRGL